MYSQYLPYHAIRHVVQVYKQNIISNIKSRMNKLARNTWASVSSRLRELAHVFLTEKFFRISVLEKKYMLKFIILKKYNED